MTTAVRFPAVRYPSTPITPHGAYHFLKGTHPTVRLRAFDDSVVFEVVGGRVSPERYTAPERVVMTAPPTGLIGPWKFVDQQGASEDGVTFLDSVNEPIDVELKVRAHARDGLHLRRVVRTLFGSLDPKRPSELSWFTQEMGRWWAQVRWAKPPVEGINISGRQRFVDLTLLLRADHGFWRSYDDVGEFGFNYEAMTETFPTDYASDLGPDWPIYATGQGGGFMYVVDGQARWRDDRSKKFFTEGRTIMAGPKRDFETETDYQVVSSVYGSVLEMGGDDDIFVRVGRRGDGTWNGYATRIRMGGNSVTLSAFINFHETVLRKWALPPMPGPLLREKWWVEAGGLNAAGEPDPRVFTIRRELFDLNVTFRDDQGITPLGASFRGVGFGMHASGALITQGTPASVEKISAGDQSGSEQTGFIPRLNIGDQPMPDRYTLFGPGIFKIGNGPGSADMVEFGPLLPNQVVQLRTDHRKRTVVDLTSVPSTAGELAEYREALEDLESFAPVGNLGPTLDANASVFGVTPPQGNLHRLLNGRFSRFIPAKSPGRPAEVQHVAVSISGGNASSRILAAGTPLRRYPQ